ncbi:MAG: thioredoxin domain-containing protein [Candidatus Nanohalobium sp.]
MADSYKCDICGEEFDSERGLHIHEGRVHGGEADEKDVENNTEAQADEDIEDIDLTETVEPSDSGSVQIPLRLAFLTVFVLGVAVGLSSGLLASGSGLNIPGTQTGNAPSNNGTGGSGSNSPPGIKTGVSVSGLTYKNDPVMGKKDAPVTMVMYEDFECPYCERFESNTFPRIKTNYIDTGKVKVVWKDYPLPPRIHPWAKDAAHVMECVYQEGGNDTFWSVKKKVYDNQKVVSSSNVDSKIKDWASQEGVSKSAIQSCLDSGVASAINEDKSEGRNKGISGTPGFLIYRSNSDSATRVVGAQPYSRFVDVLDSELNK